MRSRSRSGKENPRVLASLPFVEQLARRVAATMPHSIDIGDLVQDGVIGLIDAAQRFDESRGIKFETFAERRIRGAMIDALRKDAWPRGVRRQRRELEAAREQLRRELGCEPSLADLAAKMGTDEKKLGRTIVRINAIESTSPLANTDNLDESTLPAVLVPSEPEQPDTAYEREEISERVRNAIASLPPREQKVISLYYYAEATMKQIGAEIGVNESRVSQLHARAIRRLRDALGAQELGEPEGLGEPAAAALLEKAFRVGVRDVARDEDDAARQRWRRGRDGAVERDAVEPRHLEIADHRVVGSVSNAGEGILAIARPLGLQPRIGQRFGNRRGQRLLVFHDQHRCSVYRLHGRRHRSRLSDGVRHAAHGQLHDERRAASRIRFDANASAMLLHDGVR